MRACIFSRESPTGEVLSDIAQLQVAHTRIPPFQWNPEGVRVTFDDVTSGEKDPLERILCNFRLPIRAPHPREPPSESRDLRSLRHFRSKDPTRADIAQLPVAHAHTLLRGPIRVHVTFGHFR